ncbi:MAG: exo-alpha-sialidase [Acidimicrobiales bacterium]
MRGTGLRTRVRAGAAGLVLVLAACGGNDGGPPAGAILAAPGGDVVVTHDPNPIVARNSPDLAVNPVQRTNMVVVDRIDRPDFGAGIHVTNNSGANWQDVALTGPPGNAGKPYSPSAAYDGRGMLYVSFVTLSGPGNSPDGLWVTRSGDGGLSFDEPTRVAGPDTFHTTLAVAPRSGRVFAAWLQSNPAASECELCFARTGLPIVVSRSDDGGRTWSPPVPVSDPGRARVGAPVLGVSDDGNPAVLYVDYGDDRVDWENLPGSYDGTFSLVLAHSPDRGKRFEPGRVVDDEIVPPGRFMAYLPVRPGFAVAADGDMVAAWGDRRAGDSDVLLRRSRDDGRTWSEPVRVNRGAPGDGVPQDMPAVDVAPGGRIDVAYYDRAVDPRGPMVDVLVSSSSDGGESFPRTFRLSTQTSNRRIGPPASPFSPEADFGTRISVASLSGGAVAAWTDTRNGTADSGKQDVFLSSVALADNQSLDLGFRLLAVGGGLLGVAGVTLFVLSRRARRRATPGAEGDEAAGSESSPPDPDPDPATTH